MSQQTFKDYCSAQFNGNGACPAEICELHCLDGQDQDDCEKNCVPKACTEISVEQCPSEFCAVMVNCSQEKICHYKMPGEAPSCGNLAYEGQDVECCEGLVRRCGVEFIDGTCDMEGKESMYNLPICIPCGDGICTNFENPCNCPEDCEQHESFE